MSATLGIDLASQAKNTAICLIEWRGPTAEVVALSCGVGPDGQPLSDGGLLDLMCGDGTLPRPTKIAIDAPLGWPVDFVAAVADLERWPVAIDASRSQLERRATDLWVRDETGKLPLSVTTDRIAYPAMRAVGLLAELVRRTGTAVDRSGVAGPVCEAYPDPAIRGLGLWPADAGERESYKRAARALRERIVRQLVDAAPWLHLSDADEVRCIDSDDCLDALLCALVARAAERGLTRDPPPTLRDRAAREGWIHLPVDGALARLVDATPQPA